MMTATAALGNSRLITSTLPSTPFSVQLARSYVRSALKYHGLDAFTSDAELVISELAGNAVAHAGGTTFGVEVMHLCGYAAVSLIVFDASPDGPVLRPLTAEAEHWRGLHIVRELSASWGWAPQETGKAVYAILTQKE
jgi:anti-sigma regulatory factor (Ser/Thr protein kinase)